MRPPRPALLLLLSALAGVHGIDAQPAMAQQEDEEAPPSQASERARALFAQGVSAAREGRWEEARAAFEDAHALMPHPDILLNLAAARAHTGHLRASIAGYEQLLAQLADEPSRRDEVQSALELLRARLPRLVVRVEGLEPADRLSVDGDPVDPETAAGDGLALDPGNHVVEVGSGQTVAVRRSVTLEEGATAEVTLVASRPGDAPVEVDEGFDPNWLAFGAAGGAVVALVLTAYAWIRLSDLGDDEAFVAYRSAVPSGRAACVEAEGGTPWTLTDRELARVQDVCSEADALEVLQWVFLGLGLAAGGLAAYLFFEDPFADGSAASLQVAPRLAIDEAGLRVTLAL